MTVIPSSSTPLVVAAAMGYGHLRAAHAIASALGTEVLHADRPPLADAEEQRLWAAARRAYEATSRASQLPLAGPAVRRLLEAATRIPHLHPRRDLSPPDRPTRLLGRLVDRGLGAGLAERLAGGGRALVTTYFATAVAADELLPADDPTPIFCVGTDTDLARVWVGRRPERSRIEYLLPSRRARRRLEAYGLPPERLHFTGYPLPGELLGGPHLGALRRNLAARLVRLDPRGRFRDELGREVEELFEALPESVGGPPTIAYVVGGAGAQTRTGRQLVRSLAGWIADGRLRLALVAGVRREVAEEFERAVDDAGLAGRRGDGVVVIVEDDHDAYFRRFDRLLAEVDVLWTKPSELTFFGALGLPLVFTGPVGVQERYNRRWAFEHGAGIGQRDPRFAGDWLGEWLVDGTLAAAAWSGFLRLPKLGLERIVEKISEAPARRRSAR